MSGRIIYATKDSALSNPEQIEDGLERELKALKRHKRRIDVVYQHDGKGRRIIRETTSRPESRRRRSNIQVTSPAAGHIESTEEPPEADNFRDDIPSDQYENNIDGELDASSDIDSLNILCREVSQALVSERSSLRTVQGLSNWHQRMERREECWEESRKSIFEYVVKKEALPEANDCVYCGNKAFIRCAQCATPSLMCTRCDEEIHAKSPCHDREVWDGTHFTAVPPTVTINPENLGLTTIRRFWPIKMLWSCPNCKAVGSMKKEAVADEKRILITCEGRFDLDDTLVVCSKCNYKYGDQLSAVIDAGFWPGSISRSFRYLFSCRLLKFFDSLHKHIPGTSVAGFIHTLEEISACNGRNPTINQVAFVKALEEFRYCQFELNQLGKRLLLDCPACHGQQHSVHVDGNRKLYRYDKVKNQSSRRSYYNGTFIVKNEFVDEHLESVGYKDNNVSGMCGSSRWKAAKAASTTMKNLDETGLIVSGCRHSIAQRAINMFRGEIFGYTHYLHMYDFPARKVKYIFQDVICQYWPWANKANFPLNIPEMIPCLPAMHAKAHTWPCQVLWGGRWKDGSGGGSGEDMELLFSYLSRWGFITKNMLSYRREEFLTEAVFFWNQRKIRCLPKILGLRLRKTNEKLLKVEGKLNDIRIQSGGALSEIDMVTYKSDICATAQGELRGEEHDKDEKEEYYILWKECGLAEQLRDYSSQNTATESIITASDLLYKEANTLVAKSPSNLARLHLLESRLMIFDEESRQQCLLQGRNLTIKRKLSHFQSDMEMYFLSIKKKEVMIESYATSSKQRSKLRSSVSSEKAKLGITVSNYNSLSNMVDEAMPTSVDEVMNGEFPWSLLAGQRRTVQVQKKLEIVELFNEMKRLQEEQQLLIKEMKNYIHFYCDVVLPSLSKDIADAESCLEIATLGEVTPAAVQCLNEASQYASNSQAKDYIRGKIAYLSKCRALVMDDLSHAVDVFEHLDIEIDIDDEEDLDVLDHNSDCISDSDSDEE